MGLSFGPCLCNIIEMAAFAESLSKALAFISSFTCGKETEDIQN